MNVILGVDIGGSHITSELVDLEKKSAIESSYHRNKLNTDGSVSDIIEAWASAIETSLHNSEIKSSQICIAMPGPMDYELGICKIKDQNKYGALYEKNVKLLLAERLGYPTAAIQFKNDAACFLQGELFSGSISEFDEAIGLTLGTGLGTAHTVNGEARDSNLWKAPFLKGIAEDYISTRWFVKRFEELSGIVIRDVKDLVDNHHASPYFEKVFDEFSYNLALFLKIFIKRKRPLAAVIGGNIALAEAYFLDRTRKYLKDFMGYSFPIRKSVLGEEAAILGAGASFKAIN